jgi:inorganic pyrophosphatase
MMPNKLIGGAKGCLSCGINISPIGVLIMEDDSGMDEKVIAVPSPHITGRYESIHDHTDP